MAELLGEGQAKSGNNGVPFTYANPYQSNGLQEVTYYLHDHLGNTRVTYTSGCKTEGEPSVPIRELTLVHAADYHPYGSILREWREGEPEKYLTTHHERDTETGLDYRGARYYDAEVARFLSLDPLAADYASWSTYNYVMGNPISLVDPDGKSPECGCPNPPCPNKPPAAAPNQTAAQVPLARPLPLPPAGLRLPKMGPLGPVLILVELLSTPLSRPEQKAKVEMAMKKSSLEKTIRNQAKVMDDHLERLNRYQNDPDGNDPQKKLEGKSPEIRKRIIESTVKHYRDEIQAARKNIREAREALDKLK